MSKYTLKLLIELDAIDDLQAKEKARTLVKAVSAEIKPIREIILRSRQGHKSIRLSQQGSFDENWNKGGKPTQQA